MTTDFRALCAELVDLLDCFSSTFNIPIETSVVARARAALAEQPVGPTPIPVAERWPEFSECDPQERVWAWNPFLDHWKLSRINRSVHTHWLPANALPMPAND
jgi:hypothetical protein